MAPSPSPAQSMSLSRCCGAFSTPASHPPPPLAPSVSIRACGGDTAREISLRRGQDLTSSAPAESVFRGHPVAANLRRADLVGIAVGRRVCGIATDLWIDRIVVCDFVFLFEALTWKNTRVPEPYLIPFWRTCS